MVKYIAYVIDANDKNISFNGVDGLDGEIQAITSEAIAVKVKGTSYTSSDRLARGKNKRIYVKSHYVVYSIKDSKRLNGYTRYELHKIIGYDKG